MGADTAISWANDTFNIAIGCAKVSEACAHCYAERDMESGRYGDRFKGAWGVKRYSLSDNYWKQPLTWQRKAAAEGTRRRVFCSSLCDVFEQHPIVDAQRARLWELIAQTPNLDWLLLTKRPEYAAQVWPWATIAEAPANVWLGVTAENQRRLDERAPILLDIPARLHFLSVEPHLGDMDVRAYLGCRTCALHTGTQGRCPGCFTGATGVGWVICGGESGPQARPTHPDWVRSLRDQCREVGVAFHFKQWGEWAPGECANNLPSRSERTATWWNGKWDYETLTPKQSEETHADDAPDVYRLGRNAAGRLLDGELHDAVPQIAA